MQLAPARPPLRTIILWMILASVLYGASYQQFRMVTVLPNMDVGGLSDSISYLAMSHGNYDVSPARRYRPVIPWLASLVQKVLAYNIKDSDQRDKLSFYLVNFIFSLATAVLLQGIFGRIGFKWELQLLGSILFLTSRINVMSVGSPMVDSLYFFAIAVIVYLILCEQVTY